MSSNHVGQAIKRGIAALAAMQGNDGSFATLPSTARPPEVPSDPIFSTSSVLACVGNILPSTCRDAALQYIVKRRRSDGLWNWVGAPADADDTALSLAALVIAGQIEPSDLIGLRHFWRQPSGPFRTWTGFVNRSVKDDPIVNCNVLYCLRLIDEDTALERDAVAKCVSQSRNSVSRFSSYYLSPTTLIYAAARANLSADVTDPLVKAVRLEDLQPQEIAELLAGAPGASLDLTQRLLAAQASDGSWAGSPWFSDKVGEFYSHSYATAVAVEALCRSALRRMSPNE